MSRSLATIFALAAATTLVWGGGAAAQGVMAPAPMDLPPSMRDTPKADNQGRAARDRKPARATARSAEEGETRSSNRDPRRARTGASPRSEASRELETPQRRQAAPLELEDNPRGLSPVMQNGRPGVGMRF
jgi:hypothetical protein